MVFMRKIRTFSCGIISLVSLSLYGCCAASEPIVIERVQYQEVFVPQPCQLPMPKIAPRTGDEVLDMLAIEQHVHELRATIKGCRGE